MRSDARLFLNFLMAITIGISFGLFLGNKLEPSNTMPTGASTSDTVYLLQVGSYEQEIPANIALSELYSLDTFALIVNESTTYNIYVGISTSEEDLVMKKEYLESHNLNAVIKAKSLFSLLSFLDSNSSEYTFWYKSINYYLSLLNNQSVMFSEDYINSITEPRMPFYSSLNGLNSNINQNKSGEFKLYTYRNLVETLT
ncbi:hypothetical protein [Haloplasma contractile]|uniref:SPOR domain-containing protein n=1 Tax=Haloplasma contractile SSD-17B TaxID=1033810 RepID=F7Q169_9MOLU|nr:hypothetical protein [Haloplasma contractile]ERJ12786.1 hypothetical protein HLPCO_001126 [Haloplasma contractile SSD-17B]